MNAVGSRDLITDSQESWTLREYDIEGSPGLIESIVAGKSVTLYDSLS